MIKMINIRSFFPLLFLALAACSTPKGNYVILLPEADGSVGEISVSNSEGVETLTTGNSVIEIPSKGAPKKARELKADLVAKLVAETEAAQPPEPISFFFFFGFDNADVTDESGVVFDAVLTEISSRETVDISLIGHTDSSGSAEYNKALGLRRADKLKRVLVSNGVDPTSIDIKSLGEENLLSEGDDGDPKAFNRRVDMVLR